jgi:CHAT domain-containing protein/tetratricopeptide (TPR) repeat protein
MSLLRCRTREALCLLSMSLPATALAQDRPPSEAVASFQARADAVRQLLKAGQYVAAESQSVALRESAEAAYGPESPETALALQLRAEALWRSGKLADPRALLLRAIAIQEQVLGPDALELADSLLLLGFVLEGAIDYPGSRHALERALMIREKAVGRDDPSTTRTRLALAGSLKQTADFAGARREYERVLAIRERASGPDHPDVATVLNNYALLFRDTGELERAAEMQLRALRIIEKAYGNEHVLTATMAHNLGSLYRRMGRREEALRLYERALSLRRKLLGPDHVNVALSLGQMGELLGDMGRPREAIPLLRGALAISEKAWGPDYPDVALTLAALADIQMPSDTGKACVLARRVVRIWERQLGPDHPDLADHLIRVARCAWAEGDTAGSLDAALRAEAIGRAHLTLLARTLPEQEALQFAATRPSGLGIALSVASSGMPVPALLAAWDSVLRTRALVLDEMAARRSGFRAAHDPEIADLWRGFAEARQQLADRIVRGPGRQSPEEYRAALAEARASAERTEQALGTRSASFHRNQERTGLGLEDVRRSLSDDDALVAYVRYEAVLRKPSALATAGTPSYLALVLAQGRPRVVPLGPAREIDDLVDRWRRDVLRGGRERGAEASCRRLGLALRRRVWDPVVRVLRAPRRAFVVPDGALNLVNLGALPTGAGRYLTEEPMLLHLLSSERDLVTLRTPSVQGTGVLALGDPAFDDPSAFAVDGRDAARDPAGFRGLRSDCPEWRSSRFEPLPETRAEVASVVDVVRQIDGRDQTLGATGIGANETVFKSHAAGHRILHLATHGFALGDSCQAGISASRGIGGLAPAPTPRPAQNPLLLSGLALAGANQRETAAPDQDDGIVTADEIASLDLSGVQWAVLSACDTGVGTIQPGEGVLGLRRTFQVAGARTVIMSLWPVADESARHWMQSLYRSRWIDGRTTAEAVREATLALLQAQRRKGQSTHPFSWGAFVAAGDWH